MGRVRRKIAVAEHEARRSVDRDAAAACALCGRPLGARVERHHPVPRSEGGRHTVPVHPVCHRIIHATLTNKELAMHGDDVTGLAAHPAIARFVKWLSGKPADFHVTTRRRNRP
ncbi:HNH endonuclease [Sphingomonas sp. IW22]|uniref:HNH endonuclease n=1 Tax=Sphingomonas sp. IW22 TaxID=3242489 RepID=UPI0035229ED9